jgi:hypothetical protein
MFLYDFICSLTSGVNVGISSGGSAPSSLEVNVHPSGYDSDWALSDVVLWDRSLSYGDMKRVSDNMLASLCLSTEYWQASSSSCVACPKGALGAGSTCTCPSSTFWSRALNSCKSCPAGSTSTGLGCSCPADTFWNRYGSGVNECSPCPSGSSSSAGSSVCTCLDPNYYVSVVASALSCVPYYSAGVSGSGPWGIWRAEYFSATTSTLLEARGNGRDVMSTGAISSGSGSGAGATASVSWIEGGKSTQLQWKSVPQTEHFTMCAMARYTGSANDGQILSSNDGSFVFGFDYWCRRGISFFLNQWMTSYYGSGVITNWLVICGQNDPSLPSDESVISDGNVHIVI